jgi:hypothetical protein
MWMTTKIAYGPTKDTWQGFGKLLTNLITEYHIKRICGIGGGANPLISDEYIEDQCLDYPFYIQLHMNPAMHQVSIKES